MASTAHGTGEHSGYGLYWKTWVILLVLTLVMLGVEYFSAPKAVLLFVLLTGMVAKAGTITANFMHMRYERRGLMLIVVLSVVLTAIFLFGYLAFDAMHIGSHPAYLPE
jgi:cytochrome c oxidase subunit IV